MAKKVSGKHVTNGAAYLAAGFQIRADLAKQNTRAISPVAAAPIARPTSMASPSLLCVCS
jgi:hypothetical protein